MASVPRLGIDAMGGDYGPGEGRRGDGARPAVRCAKPFST